MSGLKDSYLILYNLGCCAGWGMILYYSIPYVFWPIGDDPASEIPERLASLYNSVEWLPDFLNIVQSLATMEIIHAVTGLVRSPAMVTAMQVSSRLVAIFSITNAPSSQDQWGAGLMILAWSLVEVPRYLFYVFALITGDATKKTPYPLFWLRYSLFYVLYPAGITGEMSVFLKAMKDDTCLNFFGPQFSGIVYGYYVTLLVVYVLGSPFMIGNMAGNRKSAMKKRFAKPPPPPRGLVWPLDKKGGRSSTGTAKAILAAAVSEISQEQGQAVLKEKNWRFGYVKHLINLVKGQCESPLTALSAATAGLDKAYEVFQFVSPDGSSVSFKEAMEAKNTERFNTGYIKGEGQRSNGVLEVPYKGKILSGEPLKAQIKKWVSYGTIEPSAGDAMIKVVDNPEWLDLSDRYFVLLGAGSAMGPFLVLMALGANVVAIDLDRPRIWKRLIDIAKKSSGTITFPLKVKQVMCKDDEELCKHAGANLFTDTPKIRDWLVDLYPGKPFTVGSYAYLDGALHVQVSLAMDAICKDLSEKRRNTSLAYLCTPTDLHLIPKEAHEAAKANYKEYSRKLYCQFMSIIGQGKFLKNNAMKPVKSKDGNNEYYMVNGISVAQGPNYALAKRMQHWRAIVARSKNCIVASNIAPATSTVSVVHNRTFAWAYEGMPYFKPYEIFAPETSNAVMSALLFFDLNQNTSSANPKTILSNPNQLFQYGSFNGGAWRCAYTVDTIGEASVLIYFSRLAKPYAPWAVAGVAVVVGKLAGLY